MPAQAQTARVVLKWKATPGVKSYHVQIAREPTFSEVVLDQRVDEPVVKWEALPSTTFYWRVRSFDSEGRASEWSPPRQIAPASSAPPPQSPEEGATQFCSDAPVPLTLAASSVLKEYQLELSADAHFPPSDGTVFLKGASNEFQLPLLPGVYVWRGRGVDLTGKATETSAPRKLVVKLGPPKLKPTTDVAVGSATVSLAWTRVPCAKRYVVEAWHETPDHATLEAAEPGLSFKPAGVGEYRFRVAAKDDKGNQSEWSAEGSFKVRLPPPTAPRESIGGQSPSGHEVEFSWTEAAGATSYVVEVASSDAFNRPTEVPATEIIARVVLKPGRYFWRVCGRDASGHPSFPSEVRKFTVADSKLPPDSVALTFPLADSVLDRPLDGLVGIAWTASASAVGYELEIDGAARPAPAPPTRVELADGDHMLRVRAQGANGLFSAWSEPRLFYFGAPRTTKAVVTFDPPLLRCSPGREARVEVRLTDFKGRRVSGNAPEFSVDVGTLSAAREEGALWVAQWHAPPELPALPAGTLKITDRAFSSSEQLPLSAEFPTLTLGGSVGGRFNGGAVASPAGVLSLGWRLLTGGGRFTLHLRGSVYRAASTATGPDGPVSQEVIAPTVSLLGGVHYDLGPWSVRGLVGPAAQLAITTVGASKQTTALPSIEAAVAGSRRLGPGAVELELSFLYGRLDTPFAKLQAGGLFLGIGYRLDLPGGF